MAHALRLIVVCAAIVFAAVVTVASVAAAGVLLVFAFAYSKRESL